MPTGELVAEVPASSETTSSGFLGGVQKVPRGHQVYWEIMAAVFLALIAHHTAIYGVFHQDDTAITNAGNIKLREWNAGRESGKNLWHVWRERPIYYLSLALNHNLGRFEDPKEAEVAKDRSFYERLFLPSTIKDDLNKDDYFGYHVFNLIGHLLAVAGLYVFVLSLLMRSHWLSRKHGLGRDALAPGWSAAGSYLPLFAAVLFAVHPLATEPVAYVMARANGWGGAFFLWACAFGVKALTPSIRLGRTSVGSIVRPVGYFLLTVLFLFLAWGFKETHVLMAVLLPISIWLSIPAALKEKLKHGRSSVSKDLTLAGVWIALVGLLFGLLKVSEPFLIRVAQEFPADPAVAFSSQGPVWVWNLARMIFPWYVSLEYDHPFRDLDDPVAWGAGVILILILGAVWYFGKRRPLLRIAGVMTCITLTPTNSILLRYDLWSDRNAYLACAAGCIVLAGFFQEFAIRLKGFDLYGRLRLTGRGWGAIAFFIIWVGVLSFRSHFRDKMYSDSETFWRYAVEKAPMHPRAHLQLAYILDSNLKAKEAKVFYKNAVDIIDEINLNEEREGANVPRELGKVKYFGHTHWAMWHSMADTRLALYDMEEGGDSLFDAEERLLMAIEDNPGDTAPLKHLVNLYLLMKEPESATEILDEVLEEGTPLTKAEENVLRDKIKNYVKQTSLRG